LPAVEKEITLGDYGRVLWSGRWVLVAAAVGAALVGLVVSLARPTEYTSSSIVYMGLVTTARTGNVVPSPTTTPVTALKALRADKYVQATAGATGVTFDRIKSGVSFAVERVPGAAGGTLPTVATITYTDKNREISKRVANAYADTVLGLATESYKGVLDAEQKIVDHGTDRIAQIEKSLDALRAANTPATAVSLISLQQELSALQQRTDDAILILEKTKIIEQPNIVSKATSPSSSAQPGQRLRTVIFGGILGLILGAIVVFIWRGSPAGRATA
jgi:uncharacterized protein involved in exopolysaccharide biosynthesis